MEIKNVPSRFLEREIHTHTQKKKVQKLSLGLYLFKRYTFVPKGYILVPYWYILAPKTYILTPKMYILVPKMYILGP